MAQRITGKNGLGPQPVNPAASPIDTYTRPTASPLEALADSLSRLDPKLEEFTSTFRERYKTQGETEAKTAWATGSKEEREAMRRAAKDGTIREDQNPFFAARASALIGGEDAEAAVGRIALRLQERGIDTLDNPDKVDEWIAEEREKILSQMGVEDASQLYKSGFAETMNNLMRELRVNTKSKVGANFGKRAYTALANTMGGVLEAGYKQPDFSAAELGKTVTLGLRRAIQEDGMDPAKANEAFLDALIQRAKLLGDPNILNLVNFVETDETGAASFGSTPWVQAAIVAARKEIQSAQDTEEALKANEDEKVYRSLLSGVYKKVLDAKNPWDVDITEELKQLADKNAPLAASFQAAFNNFRNGTVESNPVLVADYLGRIDGNKGFNPADPLKDMEEGKLTFGDYITIMNRHDQKVAKEERKNGSGSSVKDHPAMRDAEFRRMVARIRGASEESGVDLQNMPGFNNADGWVRTRATQLLEDAWFDYYEENDGILANDDKTLKRKRDFLRGALSRIHVALADDSGNTELRDYVGDRSKGEWTSRVVADVDTINEVVAIANLKEEPGADVAAVLQELGIRKPADKTWRQMATIFVESQRLLLQLGLEYEP